MNRNLRLLGIGVAVRMLGNAIYFPFLALFLRNELGVSYLGIGAIFVGVGLIQLPFNYLGGLLTDRIGRRRLILLGLVAESAATAALAYAFALHSLAGAILAATVGGTVATIAGPASSAYISDFAEGEERTRGFTFYRIGFNAGYSAGVTLGGILISIVGFAWAVGGAAIIIVGGTALLAATLEPSPMDLSLGVGKNSFERQRLRSASPPARSLRESFRILARDSVALELLVAVALAAVVVGQWAVTFPLFVRNVLGISYSLLGIGLALNGLVVVFGQTITTESVVGRRHTTIAIAGLVLYVGSFLALGSAGIYGFFPVAVFFAAVIVLTIGENLITIPQNTLPSNLAAKEELGSYNGAFSMVGGAGFLASVFIGGVVLSLTPNPLLIWVILVVPAIPSIILFRHAAGRLPPHVDRA
ncbi:MAG TPA: MFS transporter [Thermoplasmata archaeon]|nr:MFS transporter [Thermoplasmata archaeon]